MNNMKKQLSPWDPNFATGNVAVKILPDEIQHYGTASSGRYPRGSGKHPSKGGGKFKDAETVGKAVNANRESVALAKKTKRLIKKMPKVPQTKEEKVFAKGLRKRMIATLSEMRKDEGINKAGLIGGLLAGPVGTGVGMALAMKPYRKEISQLDLVITASKRNIGLANQLYNTKDVIDLEQKYLSGKKKYMDHGDNENVVATYQAMTKEQRATCWYIATLITTDDDSRTAMASSQVEHASGGTIGDVFSTLTDDQKMVVFYLAAIIVEEEEGASMEKATVTQGPSPWSEEFYTANTAVSRGEISRTLAERG